jgi:hypothetical protein
MSVEKFKSRETRRFGRKEEDRNRPDQREFWERIGSP